MSELNIQLTKRQHYVSRCYLKAWRDDEKIWCRDKINDNEYFTNLYGVAQERFFYESDRLSEDQIDIFKKLWLSEQSEELLLQNTKWLSLFCNKDSLIESFEKINDDGKQDRVIKYLRTNFEEKMHGELEKEFSKILNKLNAKEIDYFNDDKQIELLFILCVQYFRTKDKEKSLIENGLCGELRCLINLEFNPLMQLR